MKRLVLAMAAAGVLAMAVPQAKAGDREWATAGKVLTGVVAGAVIANSFQPGPGPVYGLPAPFVAVQRPVVVAPAPVCAPAPVYVAPPCYPPRVVVHPAPVVSFQLGFGRHYCPPPRHHHHHGHTHHYHHR